MITAKPKYNIKVVSQMLAIQPGTLRAWERRYKIIRPARNEAGHRLYTDDHIKTLKWLVEKVESGFTISQAVSLLTSNEECELEIDLSNPVSELSQKKDELLNALLSFNESEAQKRLEQLFGLFTLETVTLDIIAPMLKKVGDLWEEGQITSAHEHFVSSFLKAKLGMMLHSTPSNPAQSKALLVCGPNESHEIGLLVFGLYLKRKGYEVVYLGQSIANTDLEKAVSAIAPSYLFMSCTMRSHILDAVQIAESLEERFPKVIVGIGGPASDRLVGEELTRVEPFIVGNNRREWDAWLQIQ